MNDAGAHPAPPVPQRTQPPAWTARRRPTPRALLVYAVIGIVVGALSLPLTRMLMLRPDWNAPALVALGLAAAVLWFAAEPTTVTVDADGLLRAGTGRRVDLELPLPQATAVTALGSAAWPAAGIAIDPALVVFRSRKGPSYRSLRRWRATLGVDVVLAHLRADDVAALAALRIAQPPRTPG